MLMGTFPHLFACFVVLNSSHLLQIQQTPTNAVENYFSFFEYGKFCNAKKQSRLEICLGIL